jgi:hypothetical protein
MPMSLIEWLLEFENKTNTNNNIPTSTQKDVKTDQVVKPTVNRLGYTHLVTDDEIKDMLSKLPLPPAY